MPYLTKEQIETEGWEWVGKDYDVGTIFSFRKGKYDLFLDFEYSSPSMQVNNIIGDVLYLGECKSINEFRYICKLLKI